MNCEKIVSVNSSPKHERSETCICLSLSKPAVCGPFQRWTANGQILSSQSTAHPWQQRRGTCHTHVCTLTMFQCRTKHGHIYNYRSMCIYVCRCFMWILVTPLWSHAAVWESSHLTSWLLPFKYVFSPQTFTF